MTYGDAFCNSMLVLFIVYLVLPCAHAFWCMFIRAKQIQAGIEPEEMAALVAAVVLFNE